MVGTVKKSIAVMASRWLRRKLSQHLLGSEPLGAPFIQREMVLSDTSKPSMRSSPWMRGAPQVGFSALIWRINRRTSLDIGLLPMGLFEMNVQYKRNPAWCQRTTVSGVSTMRACFQPNQNRRTSTHNSLSSEPSLGRGCRRFRMPSCCRRARFSRTRFRRLRNARKKAPTQRLTRLNMTRIYTRSSVGLTAVSC
jgi:hypothetical protein